MRLLAATLVKVDISDPGINLLDWEGIPSAPSMHFLPASECLCEAKCSCGAGFCLE